MNVLLWSRYWRQTLGSPPWAPADATPLDQFCRAIEVAELNASEAALSVDCEDALHALRNAGIAVEDISQPLDDIAAANSTTPRAIADVVLSVARREAEPIEVTTPE